MRNICLMMKSGGMIQTAVLGIYLSVITVLIFMCYFCLADLSYLSLIIIAYDAVDAIYHISFNSMMQPTLLSMTLIIT